MSDAILETFDLYDICSEWWGDLTWPKKALRCCDIWDTDYNTDNWEPEFMTIFVIWQLIVTLDSIRNSCDVFFKHPPNTLQTPCNTLQAPLKHPSTPFKQPSKSSFFYQKMVGKKINRDFIKGGRGGVTILWSGFTKNLFFHNWRLPLASWGKKFGRPK